MFRTRGLSKSYEGEPALADINLEFEPGEQAAVIGPSGAGKTTLLHLLGGLLEPDAGTVELAGQDITELSPGRELSQLVGVMHQQFDLVDQLSAIHNVLAGKLGDWSLWRSLLSLIFPQQRELAYRALDRLGIRDKAHEKTAHLSGGEQQRVALARLLLQQPRVLLADEPVASVDPARARNLLNTLVKLAEEEELTLVVSLHSVDLALEFFPRIIGLKDGVVEFDRPSQDVGESILESLYEFEDPSSSETITRR